MAEAHAHALEQERVLQRFRTAAMGRREISYYEIPYRGQPPGPVLGGGLTSDYKSAQ